MASSRTAVATLDARTARALDRASEAEIAARCIEEAGWVSEVLAGRSDAYRRLVERYQRPVYGTILRFVGSPADAEDLAQHAFMNAYRALAQFDQSRRFSTWLLSIAVNAAKDWLKSHKRGERPLEDAVEPRGVDDPEQAAIARDQGDRLRRLLASLPIEYREVVVLKDVEGLSFDEIQEILDLPLTTLKMRAVRGRAMLKQRLLEAELA